MEKVIEIDIFDEENLVETYNNKNISTDLIKYVIDEAKYVSKKEKIKIVINKDSSVDKNYGEMLKEGFKREYEKSLRVHHVIDSRQVIFTILGIAILFFTSFINDESIWKEVLIIGAWVLIWETIELELFSDAEERRKRKILKNLLKAEIVEE